MQYEKKRVGYFDLIKGISIILVVFCHYTTLSDDTILGNVVMAMAWGAVPCFFMVTGGLMHTRTSNWNMKKHLRKIGKTYVVLCIWRMIYLIVFAMMREVSFSKADFIKYEFFFGTIPNVDTGVMWFMYAYLMILIFAPISIFLFKDEKEGQKLLIYILVILFISSLFLKECNFILDMFSRWTGCNMLTVDGLLTIIPFGSYINMLFYFILGGFLFKNIDAIQRWLKHNNFKKCMPVILIMIGTIGLVLEKYALEGTFRWNGIYIPDGYNRITTLVLAVGIYLACATYNFHRVGSFISDHIGRETMGIYYIHYLVVAFASIKLSHFYEQYYSFGLNIVKTVVAVFICICLTRIIKKIPVIQNLVS